MLFPTTSPTPTPPGHRGGAFRRSRVVFRPRVSQPYWRSPFLPEYLDNGIGRGCGFAEIEKDYDADLRLVYDPTHPDAIKTGPGKGYVEYPNVNIVERDGGYDFRQPFLRGKCGGNKRFEIDVYAGHRPLDRGR